MADVPASSSSASSGPPRALTADAGLALSRPTKSRPVWPPRTPRWILRCFDAVNANVPVEGGIYHANRVRDEALGATTLPTVTEVDAPGQRYGARRELGRSVVDPKGSEPIIDACVADYDPSPAEIPLNRIQSIVRTETHVPALLSDTHDQVQWQLKLAAEFIYETKEHQVFNHPTHGLLNNVDEAMEVQVDGPPSPAALDDLLARAWKRPDCYFMNPLALAEFHKQASDRSLKLDAVDIFGSTFTAWRGLPIFPTDKLEVGGGEDAATTDVLLLRMGEENQGVVSLVPAGVATDQSLPFITVEFMGLSDDGVASRLVTTYTAVAVLSPGSLARAQVVI
jgi:hypothetical protein